MLEIIGLSSGYGGAAVLKEVSLHVGAGEIVTVIGTNGAGKTTLLNTVAGLLRPLGGIVRLDGEPIGGRPTEKIVRAGESASVRRSNIGTCGRVQLRTIQARLNNLTREVWGELRLE